MFIFTGTNNRKIAGKFAGKLKRLHTSGVSDYTK